MLHFVPPAIIPMPRIGIIVYKQEAKLEMWGAKAEGASFTRMASFKIAKMSGGLGPKRKEGDLQVPEGFYHIDRFNPKSRFHLSLGINYPNASDKILGDKDRPGADIFIHGGELSIGCMAMTDRVIDVIYNLASFAKDSGQSHIPVFIFPTAPTPAKMRQLKEDYKEQPKLLAFWDSLAPGYEIFMKTKRFPKVGVNTDGSYKFSS